MLLSFNLLTSLIKGTALQYVREYSQQYLLTDSRKILHPTGSLFFAIRGAFNNGHNYVPSLYVKGVRQFIVENIILTFFGCVIGIALGFIILQIINNSALIDNMHLTINLTVLIFSLFACLVFGLLSGVYPAWRMSKLQVVTALKAQ